jgi:hypothetical protein
MSETIHGFSHEEQALLSGAPVAVIAAMIGASISNPVGITQEVGAAVAYFQKSAERYADNPLIAAALVDLKGSYDRYLGGGEEAETQQSLFSMAGDQQSALEAVRKAATFVATQDPGHSASYRHWVEGLARTVAEAALEGGFMGIGGEPVSSEERTLLDEIVAILQ